MARYEPLKTPHDVLESGATLDGRAKLSEPGRKRWTDAAKRWGGWAVAAVLVLHTMRSGAGRFRSGEEACWDPFHALGYIHRPANGSIRWIPYPPSFSSASSLAQPAAIDGSLDPPPDALRLSAPPYGDMLDRIGEEDGMREMEWARGKRAVFIGDSHDRSNIEAFCKQHPAAGAELSVPHFHIKAHCRIPSLNLTISSWFHYGLAPESDSLPSSPSSNTSSTLEETGAWYIPNLPTSHPNENPAPYAVEGRMKEYWIPDTETSVDDGGMGGKPDLIVLNSFFWDLRYLALHARAHPFSRPSSLRADERPLTLNELEWHRLRVRDFVQLVRETFPGVPVMFRLGQDYRTTRNQGNVAVFQLNESLRAILKELDVPVFEWARLISGEDRYNDDQHLAAGAPARLFTDMALFYLRKAVEGRWDVCEKPPSLSPETRRRRSIR
ncbi:hypothetical protein JCM8547_007643 [Rhodosporidiobolus lusitaniae]